ncbi:4'-phosphopantetheinyl transferase superfamily protein [soil metagenome]
MRHQAVYSWPEQRELIWQNIRGRQLSILSIQTQTTASRDVNRQHIRAALSDVLCSAFDCQAEQLALAHVPGQRPGKNGLIVLPEPQTRAPMNSNDSANSNNNNNNNNNNNHHAAINTITRAAKLSVHFSISHETGLSIAAVAPDSKVGLDIVLIDPDIDWHSVSQLYLGPRAYLAITCMPPDQQAGHFSLLWACHEARLKCHGIAVSEWSPQLERTLADCQVRRLNLPSGYAGAVALQHQPTAS